MRKFLEKQIGVSQLCKLLTGLDPRGDVTENPKEQVTLLMDYTIISVKAEYLTARVKVQLTFMGAPLLKAHSKREEIGMVEVPYGTDLEKFYKELAYASLEKLQHLDHAHTLNGTAKWLLPLQEDASFTLALN